MSTKQKSNQLQCLQRALCLWKLRSPYSRGKTKEKEKEEKQNKNKNKKTRREKMGDVMHKMGTYMFQQKASKELSSVGNEIHVSLNLHWKRFHYSNAWTNDMLIHLHCKEKKQVLVLFMFIVWLPREWLSAVLKQLLGFDIGKKNCSWFHGSISDWLLLNDDAMMLRSS